MCSSDSIYGSIGIKRGKTCPKVKANKMKTFNEWVVENHPEMIDEVTFSPAVRNFGAAALLAAGGLGMMGRSANAADTKNPVKQSEEEDHDEDFIAGDLDDDAEIQKEKEYMLRKAAQLKTTTTRQNDGVVVSRGSGHMVGGKVVGPSQQGINKGVQKASQSPKKFNSTRRLPELKRGPAQSPDFKGGVE